MKKQLIGTGICLAILVAAGFFFLQRGGLAAGVQGVLSGEVLLIDAGHGGIDGGAESGWRNVFRNRCLPPRQMMATGRLLGNPMFFCFGR